MEPTRRPRRRRHLSPTTFETEIRPSSGARQMPVLDSARPVADFIETVIQDIAQRLPSSQSGPETDLRSELEREWPDLVGPRFASLLRPGPTFVRATGTLIVWAKHPVALFEARLQLRDLAARIRRRWPAAPWTSVQFRLEPTDLTGADTPGV